MLTRSNDRNTPSARADACPRVPQALKRAIGRLPPTAIMPTVYSRGGYREAST